MYHGIIEQGVLYMLSIVCCTGDEALYDCIVERGLVCWRQSAR